MLTGILLNEGCRLEELKEVTDVYSEPCQTSKMEVFANTVNSFQLLTIFENSQGSESVTGSGGYLIWQVSKKSTILSPC